MGIAPNRKFVAHLIAYRLLNEFDKAEQISLVGIWKRRDSYYEHARNQEPHEGFCGDRHHPDSKLGWPHERENFGCVSFGPVPLPGEQLGSNPITCSSLGC